MKPTLVLAAATYGEITRRPVYSILLVCFAVGIFLSKFLTLFSFFQEINMVREMGLATITFWAFIIILLLSGVVVTLELEDRTAVTLLSKPILRRDFLLGKYFGLLLSLLPGLAVLASVLFLTLFMMARPHIPLTDVEIARGVEEGRGSSGAAWAILWQSFLATEGRIVLQGTMLSFLQASVLAALAVSLCAFLPVAVSVAAVTLAFVLGNLSSYMLASIERLGVGPLSAAGNAFVSLMPNLGYFNLQTHFSEGRIISAGYLALAVAYAGLYVSAIFLVSCSLFRTREVR